MILVVADSSPIRYLIVIGEIELLPRLYEKVVLPSAVVAELTHPNAPMAARYWSERLPGWIEVREARLETTKIFEQVLDPGEAAAIALAQEIGAELVLLDEREARRVAVEAGLKIAGTVGVLEAAAERGLVDLGAAFRKLLATNFRIDSVFLKEALARDAKRKSNPS